MTDDLRSALSAGDTPAGVDVGLVRARAHRLRRRRMALATAAAAAVTAISIAVPVGLLGADPAPPAAPAPATLGCPDTVPDPPRNRGPGLAEALVPFSPDEGLICSYSAGSRLTGVVRLTGAEVRSAVERLDRGPRDPRGLICTSEFGEPFALQVGGAGRAVTLRLQPYGCARVTNGMREVYAGPAKELMRGLAAEAGKSTACPEQLDVPPAVRTDGEAPGASLLPTDTRRLLVCRYSFEGHRERKGKMSWNVALAGAEARRVVDELNASPPLRPRMACTREGGPRLVLHAVTPDGVVSAVADAGGCGVVDNGARQVTNKALVRALAG